MSSLAKPQWTWARVIADITAHFEKDQEYIVQRVGRTMAEAVEGGEGPQYSGGPMVLRENQTILLFPPNRKVERRDTVGVVEFKKAKERANAVIRRANEAARKAMTPAAKRKAREEFMELLATQADIEGM